MHRIIYIFIMLVISCGVKQPLDIGTNATISCGSLFISSQPPSASIFIDNILQSTTTPDTIYNIPVGIHHIKVFKQGYTSPVDSITVDVKKDSLHILSFSLQEIIYKSFILVTSEPYGATVYLDGQITGLQTPDTLEVEPGQHEISIVKNGFETVSWNIEAQNDVVHTLSTEMPIFQRVLLEAFGNVACDPCVESAENLEKFLAEYPDGHYALFEYYANWPAPNDPFYATAPDAVDERVKYYEAYSLPTLKMNGKTGVEAKDYDQIVAHYTDVLSAQNAKLAISIQKEKTADQLQIKISVYDRDDVLSNSNLRLFAAIAEDSLYYENSGGNGLTDFNFVFRRFLSSKKGDIISSTELDFNMDWPAGWNYANSKIVAFIQDMNTKKIIQTTIN